MTNVLARFAVAWSALLLVACGGVGGGGNVSTGVCEAGQFRCSGDVLETCSVDRTGFTTVATCQAGLCDAAGKQCDNCKAGEGTCTGASAGKLCSADGQKLEDVTCSGSTPFCAASGTKAACVACRASADCAPSTNPCALSVGGADGTCGTTAVAANTVCGTNGGQCDGAGKCRECNPEQKRCSGIEPQSCGLDGKWVTAAACGGSAPLCVGGECLQCVTSADCPTSANACTQAVCNNGTCGYVAKPQGTTCPGGTCSAVGVCNACSPGTKVCNGNQVLICNANGQYDPPSSCGGSTPYCENSSANCVQCTSVAQCAAPSNPCLQAACTGNACAVSARPDGTLCAVGSEAGTCQSGTCTLCSAGQTRCLPGTNIPQSCSAGLWVGSAACASPTAICTAGACVECITAANCPSSTNPCLQAVCTSGVCGFAAKTQGTACSGGTCNGSGQCNACTPNTSVCNGNQILTCGSNGQYTAPTTCNVPTPYCDGATTTCVQCTSAAHCAAPTNPCLQATCSGGNCGVSVRADGTACSVGSDSGTCSAGNCAVCTNGATRCKPSVTTTPQQCVSGLWVDQAACGSSLTCFQGTCSCATGSIYDGASRFYGFDSTLTSRDGATTLSTNGSCVFEADRFGVAGRAVKPSTCGAGKPEVADSTAVRGATITVSAWVKPNGASGGLVVTKAGWASASNEQYALGVEPSGIAATVGFYVKHNSGCVPGVGWVGAEGTPMIALGVWTHVVGVFDGSSVKVFVDGQLVKSTPTAFNSIDSCVGAPLRIGSNWSGDPRTFDGLIDDVAVWTRGLSEAEVTALYQSSLQCGG